MKRRLFLSGFSASALALVGCGGGGGGGAATDGATASMVGGLPGSAAASAGGGGNLPARVLATYYTGWDAGALRITDVPREFNVIYLFHAKPAGNPVNGNWNNAGDGSFTFEFYGDVPAADIQAVRGRGTKVILTVGGAQAGYNFDTRAKSQNFVNSFRTMYDRLGGVDGCDFNNFEANIGSSPAEMVWIAQQLKGLYGAGFAITAPPQPNSPEDRAMLKAMATAGVLDWAAPQYYDWSGFNAPGFISGRTGDWVRDLGQEHVMVGLSANYPNGPTLDDCVREWNAVKAAYPNIRGMFCWNALLNVRGGNAFGRTMQGLL